MTLIIVKLISQFTHVLLTPQGKFLADFFIIKILDTYLIEIHEKYFETFLFKLKLYKLRSKVDFFG